MARVFAIADLHLSLSGQKPMDRFGSVWAGHAERIRHHWLERITEQDLVLLPGDLSWGMRLEDAKIDLDFIAALPGVKLLLRGNHDYWWQSLSKLRKAFPTLHFLQNDAFAWENVGICGTRGWDLRPARGFEDPDDDKIYRRELERLKLSIQALPRSAEHRIAMLHYPPLMPYLKDTDFSRLLAENRIQTCVYGHLHLANIDDESSGPPAKPFEGEYRGVQYRIVACDRLDMVPLQLLGEVRA